MHANIYLQPKKIVIATGFCRWALFTVIPGPDRDPSYDLLETKFRPRVETS